MMNEHASSSRLSLPGNTYKDRRSWGDMYVPAMSAMAAELLQTNNLISPTFTEPTLYEDRRLGIDMYVEWDRIKLSYRTRQYGALAYALEGFTLRTSGTTSELDKVMAGVHADFLLYGIASPEDDGRLCAGLLIDLKSVGSQLIRFPSILERATAKQGFIDFSYDSFPYSVVVGLWGLKEKSQPKEVH